MQTKHTATITINAVAYCAADIAKAAVGGISVKPNANEIVDEGDALVLPGFTKTALFRIEGKLRVIARGEEHQGYVLINKHSLKKTHAAYEPVYVPPAMSDDRRAPHRDEQRDGPHRGGISRSPFGRNNYSRSY